MKHSTTSRRPDDQNRAVRLVSLWASRHLSQKQFLFVLALWTGIGSAIAAGILLALC